MVIEEIVAYNKLAELLDFIFERLAIPENIKAVLLTNLWSNKKLLIDINEKVKELWLKQ